MATVTVFIASGARHIFHVPSDATIKQAKQAAAVHLNQPHQLQRWILDGSPLGDEELVCGSMEVFCVFLAPQFDITVKVVQFTPPAQSELLGSVRISASPIMTVHSLKFKVAEMHGLQAGKAMRLFQSGNEMQDGHALEAYHLDSGDTLELVARRRPDKEKSMNAGMTDMEKNYRIFMGLDDTASTENGKGRTLQTSSSKSGLQSSIPLGAGQALLQAALAADDGDMAAKRTEVPTTGLRLLRRLSGDKAAAGHALLQGAFGPDALDSPQQPEA